MPIRSRSTRTCTGSPRPRLAAALRAVERGWPVFPLYPYSKYPAVRDWENSATLDLDEITRWWATAPYNIGIACKPAGLVVIDLDAARGQRPPSPWAQLGVTHGRDVLRILAERAEQLDPIDTYTVVTPSGGEHRYFLAPADRELRNTTGDTGGGLGWGIICSRSSKHLVTALSHGEACEARFAAGSAVRRCAWLRASDFGGSELSPARGAV